MTPEQHTAEFPADWTEWSRLWAEWKQAHTCQLGRTSWRFGRPNLLADSVLGKWSIKGRPVELSEVTMPDFGARDEQGRRLYGRVRFVGITFGSGSGSDRPDAPLAASFAELEKELGL